MDESEGETGRSDVRRGEAIAPGSLQRLDLRGLNCPLPVLHTRRALRRLTAAQCLEVRCSDPLAMLDIPNLLRETGDELLSVVNEADGSARFAIRKR